MSSNDPVGIRSLAVSFPEHVRTNAHWRAHHPGIVAEAERRTLARVFSNPAGEDTPWDRAMAPYLRDPFRGTQERRILAPGETGRAIEARAARQALEAAAMDPADVDLLLVASLRPDQLGPGNAAFLVRDLGLQGTAWNLESTCSGSLVALQSATALIRAGEYRNALVVTGSTYSRDSDEGDSLSWFFGDGAGAFLVDRLEQGQGVLGIQSVHSADTCGTFHHAFGGLGPDGEPRFRIRASPRTNQLLRASGERALQSCARGALAKAGLALGDVDFLVCNTPTAWYSDFCARVLGLPPERTVSAYPRFGNVGPALTATNLHAAAQAGKIREGDVVLVFTIGSVSTAGAAVMRWGDVKLGPDPGPGVPEPCCAPGAPAPAKQPPVAVPLAR